MGAQPHRGVHAVRQRQRAGGGAFQGAPEDVAEDAAAPAGFHLGHDRRHAGGSPGAPPSPGGARFRTRSVLAVPIFADSTDDGGDDGGDGGPRVVGVVEVLNPTGADGRFTDAEVGLVEAFARHVGLAVANCGRAAATRPVCRKRYRRRTPPSRPLNAHTAACPTSHTATN